MVKRVAMLSVHSCPLGHLGARDTGGMNVYVRELSRELGRRGLKVDVFTRYRNCDHPCEVEIGEGARLVHLGAGASADVSKYDLYEYMPEFAGNVITFQQENHLTYDLIHSHYWLSGWVGEILRACWNVPHLTTFHTIGRIKNLIHEIEKEPELRLVTEQRVMHAADRVLALTDTERNLISRLFGVSLDRLSVVPGGVDTTIFRPQSRLGSRGRLCLPPGDGVLLYVGRIEPLKGIDVLIEAISLLPEAGRPQCLVVGGNTADEGEAAELRDLAARLGAGDKLKFIGPVDHERLPDYYNAADVTVVPSRYESFGLVALESLACGTPVVATDVGGLPAVVRHGENGYLVPMGDLSGFGSAISRVLSDRALRRRLSKAGPETARKFAWPSVADGVLDLYRQLEKTYADGPAGCCPSR
ncbi:MAG: glycosyltransferase [Chloroflexi bacterium]|nr:glycosyltransferase [Chloroflexota bacterium]